MIEHWIVFILVTVHSEYPRILHSIWQNANSYIRLKQRKHTLPHLARLCSLSQIFKWIHLLLI